MLVVRERSESRMISLEFFLKKWRRLERTSLEGKKKKVKQFSFEPVKLETSVSNV